MSRQRATGEFRVGGQDKRMPTTGAAISFAINVVERAPGELQVGVFDGDDQRVARVTRHADRSVTIEATRG